MRVMACGLTFVVIGLFAIASQTDASCYVPAPCGSGSASTIPAASISFPAPVIYSAPAPAPAPAPSCNAYPAPAAPATGVAPQHYSISALAPAPASASAPAPVSGPSRCYSVPLPSSVGLNMPSLSLTGPQAPTVSFSGAPSLSLPAPSISFPSAPQQQIAPVKVACPQEPKPQVVHHPDVDIPLVLPDDIPIGKYCSCQKYQIRPAIQKCCK